MWSVLATGVFGTEGLCHPFDIWGDAFIEMILHGFLTIGISFDMPAWNRTALAAVIIYESTSGCSWNCTDRTIRDSALRRSSWRFF